MRAIVVTALFLAIASQAAAQPYGQTESRAEPWRAPVDQPGTHAAENRAHTTSRPAASAPPPPEQREARALAGAVFAKPAAAHRAAEKAAPPQDPELAAVQPKPEWSDDKS